MNEIQIRDYLMSQIQNEFGVFGLMGNLFAESGLNPKNLQNSYEKSLKMTDATYTANVDSGKYQRFVKDQAGYGLAQWTSAGRKQNLLNYRNSKGTSIGDLQMQLEFLVKELQTSYKSVYNTLKNAKSIKEASNAVLHKFESPRDQSAKVENLRASYGYDLYNKYHNASSTTNATSVQETTQQSTQTTESAGQHIQLNYQPNQMYKVAAKSGVVVRINPTKDARRIGALACGTEVLNMATTRVGDAIWMFLGKDSKGNSKWICADTGSSALVQ